MADEENEVLVKVGALWDKPNSFQGKMGEARLVILPNKHKKEDKHPDRIVYVCNPKKKEKPQDDSPF